MAQQKKPAAKKPAAKKPAAKKPAAKKPAAKKPAAKKPAPRPKSTSRPRSKTKTKSNAGSSTLLQSTVQSPVPHVKFGFITMFLAWLFALLPIPGISYLGTGLFSSITLILAVICLVKEEIMGGIWIMAGVFVGTPIMYFIGFFVMALAFAK